MPDSHTVETQVVGELDRRLAEERADAEKAAAADARKRAAEARTRKPATTQDGES